MKSVRKLIKANYHQVLPVFIVFPIMVPISYFYASHIVRRQVELVGDTSLETIQAQISDSLQNSEPIFSNIAQNIDRRQSARFVISKTVIGGISHAPRALRTTDHEGRAAVALSAET